MSIRICRLFFWFDGAPEDRPGGPWWYRDFLSEEDRDKFIVDTRRFLHIFVICDVKDTPYRVDEASKGMLYIQPPPRCESACDCVGPRRTCTRCGWS